MTIAINRKFQQILLGTKKKVGQGTKVVGEDVDKMFKGIGDGIEDVGRNM